MHQRGPRLLLYAIREQQEKQDGFLLRADFLQEGRLVPPAGGSAGTCVVLQCAHHGSSVLTDSCRFVQWKENSSSAKHPSVKVPKYIQMYCF